MIRADISVTVFDTASSKELMQISGMKGLTRNLDCRGVLHALSQAAYRDGDESRFPSPRYRCRALLIQEASITPSPLPPTRTGRRPDRMPVRIHTLERLQVLRPK